MTHVRHVRVIAFALALAALAGAAAAQPALFYPTPPNGGSRGPRPDHNLPSFTVNVTNTLLNSPASFRAVNQIGTVLTSIPPFLVPFNTITATPVGTNVLLEGRNQIIGQATDAFGGLSNIPDRFTSGPSLNQFIFVDTDEGPPNNPTISGLVTPSTNVTVFSLFNRRVVFNKATPGPLTVDIAGTVNDIPTNPANPVSPESSANVTATIVPVAFSGSITPLVSPLGTLTRPFTVAFTIPVPAQPTPPPVGPVGSYDFVPNSAGNILDFTKVRDGIYQIRLTAQDIANNLSPATTTSLVTIDLDRVPPSTPTITFPTTTVPLIVDGTTPVAPFPSDRIAFSGIVGDERGQGDSISINVTNSAGLLVPTNPTTQTTTAPGTGAFSVNMDFRPGQGIVPPIPPAQDLWQVDFVAFDPDLNPSPVRSVYVIRDTQPPAVPVVTFPPAGFATSSQLLNITANVTNTLATPNLEEYGTVAAKIVVTSTVNVSKTATFIVQMTPSPKRHDASLDNALSNPNALGLIPDSFNVTQTVDLSQFPPGGVKITVQAIDQVGNTSAPSAPITITIGPRGAAASMNFALSGPDDNYQFIGTRTNERGSDDGDPDGVPGFFVSLKSPERFDAGVPPSVPRPAFFGPPPLDTDPGNSNTLIVSGFATDVATPVTQIIITGPNIATTTTAPAVVSLNTTFTAAVDMRAMPEGLPSLVTIKAVDSAGLSGATTSITVFRDVIPGRAPRITFPPLLQLPFGSGTIPGFFTGRTTTQVSGVAEPNALVAALTPITTGTISVPIPRTSNVNVPIRAAARDSIPPTAQTTRADAFGNFNFPALNVSTVATGVISPVPILFQTIDSFDNTDPVSSVTPIGVFRTNNGGSVVQIVLDPQARNFKVFPGTPPRPVVQQFFAIETILFKVTYSTIIVQPPLLSVQQFNAATRPAELIAPAQPSAIATEVLVYRYKPIAQKSTFDGPVTLSFTEGKDIFGFVPNPAAFQKLVFIDSTPPVLFPVSPAPALSGSGAPSIAAVTSFFPGTGQQVNAVTTLNVTVVDPPPGNGAVNVSCVSTTFSSIKLIGPLEQTSANSIPLVEPPPAAVSQPPAVPCPPFLFTRVPVTPVTTQGTYEIRADVGDNVGNVQTFISTFILDRTPVGTPFIVTNPADKSAVTTLPLFGTSQAVFVTIIDPQPDLNASRAFLFNPNHVSIGQAAIPTGTNTLVVKATRPLPDRGLADGIYFIEADVFDKSGNPSPHVTHTFLLDTLPPMVLSFFPGDFSCVRAPLREVHSEIVDSLPPLANPFPPAFSGVDLTRSTIDVKLLGAAPTNPTTSGTVLKAARSFRTISGSPFTVLDLQFLDASGAVRSLANDGTEDGTYGIEVKAVDAVGNTTSVTGVFHYDTIPPHVTLTQFPEGSFMADATFVMGGEVFDPGGCGLTAGVSPTTLANRDVQVSIRRRDALGNIVSPVAAPFFDFTNVTAITRQPVPASFVKDDSRWIFAGNIPASPGPARVLVRATDIAGNVNVITRDITIQAATLAPPGLISPPNASFTRNKLATFAWSNVIQAGTYDLELTRVTPTPLTTRTTFFALEFPLHGFGPVDLPQICQTVPGGSPITSASTFSWRVRSNDVSLNAGSYSTPSTFVVDPNPPTVGTVTINVTSTPAVAVVTSGTVNVTIDFNEETAMDTSRPPTVFVRLFNPALPTVSVTQLGYKNKRWTGRFTAPIADGGDPNGLAQLTIRDAYDLAGNALAQTLVPLRIDAGPFFDVRFFANPAAPDDIEMVIRAFPSSVTTAPLRLAALPAVTALQQGQPAPEALATFAIPSKNVTSSSFHTAYFVDPSFIGLVDLTITGTSLTGSTATRHVPLLVAGALAKAGVSFPLTVGRGHLSVPKGRGPTVVLGPPGTCPDTIATGAAAELARRGLVPIAPLGYLTPDGPALLQPLQIDVTTRGMQLPAGVLPRQLLLVRVGGGQTVEALAMARGGGSIATTHPTAATHQSPTMMAVRRTDVAPAPGPVPSPVAGASDLWASFNHLGLLYVVADTQPPGIDVTWPQGELGPRPRIQAHATDEGSGLDLSSARVVIDGVAMAAPMDTGGQIDFSPGSDLSAGDHTLEIRVSDRAGNQKITTRHALSVGGPTGIDQAIAVPNPVSIGPCHIRVMLTGPATTLRVKIYDAAGRQIQTISTDDASGTVNLDWELDSSRGAAVASGIYFFRVEAQGSDGSRVTRTGKIAVLR